MRMIRQLAERDRLRLKRDECGAPVVPGRFGIIYDNDDDGEKLGVMVIGRHSTARIWSHRRRACLAAGMKLYLDGDEEGALIFDPTDPQQVKAATHAIQTYRKRQLSPDHRQRLIAAGTRFRFESARV